MKFCGNYVTNLHDIFMGSALAGQNTMTISAPGWGKTEMALQSAKAIAGDNGSVFVELDPSTPPEVINGAYDPAEMLNGRLTKIVTNTPYDPNAHIVILDEIWRANDVVFDALVHATNNKRIDSRVRPIFWGTSNFVGKAERTEALRDRFALWLHVDGDMDSADIVTAHLTNGNGIDEAWGKNMPSWDECVRIHYTSPSARALEAIKDTIEALTQEAGVAGFSVNPRRVVQWGEILHRVSTFHYGSEDYTSIHPEAGKLLKFAFPCATKPEAQKWSQVAMAIADRVGSAIESYRAIAVEKFRQVASQKSMSDKTALVSELGKVLSETENELIRLGGDIKTNPNADPRVAETMQELMNLFSKAVRGEGL